MPHDSAAENLIASATATWALHGVHLQFEIDFYPEAKSWCAAVTSRYGHFFWSDTTLEGAVRGVLESHNVAAAAAKETNV